MHRDPHYPARCALSAPSPPSYKRISSTSIRPIGRRATAIDVPNAASRTADESQARRSHHCVIDLPLVGHRAEMQALFWTLPYKRTSEKAQKHCGRQLQLPYWRHLRSRCMPPQSACRATGDSAANDFSGLDCRLADTRIVLRLFSSANSLALIPHGQLPT